MCIHPRGEFELVRAAVVVGLQREDIQPGIPLHLTPAEGDGFLGIVVQANIVKGMYWAKKISLGWRLVKCDASQESLLLNSMLAKTCYCYYCHCK